MKRAWLACGIALLVLAPGGQAAYQPGDHINNFTLYDGHGVQHSLYDYSGDVILINWWQDT